MKKTIQHPHNCHWACLESILFDFYDQIQLKALFPTKSNFIECIDSQTMSFDIRGVSITKNHENDIKTRDIIEKEYKENEKEIIICLNKTADGICFEDLRSKNELPWINHCIRIAKHDSSTDLVLIMDPDPNDSIDKLSRKVFKRKDGMKECTFDIADTMRTRGSELIEYYLIERK